MLPAWHPDNRAWIAVPSAMGFAQVATEYEVALELNGADHELEPGQCSVGTQGANVGETPMPLDVAQPGHAIAAHRGAKEVDEIPTFNVRAGMPEHLGGHHIDRCDTARFIDRQDPIGRKVQERSRQSATRENVQIEWYVAALNVHAGTAPSDGFEDARMRRSSNGCTYLFVTTPRCPPSIPSCDLTSISSNVAWAVGRAKAAAIRRCASDNVFLTF
jgi:hypothetical protein